MRQTDRRTAENVLNIVREVKDPSRMLQRLSIVMSEQNTINSIFNEFASCSVRDGSGPNKNFIAIRSSSGAPYPRTNAGRAPKKLKMKKLRKEEEQQKRLAEKGAKKTRKSIQKVNNK